MASSDAELKDGFNIPVWMKTKPTRDFEPFAASPPGPDDAFFIRYPNTKNLFGANEREVTKVLRDPPVTIKDKDWSRHTKSCQDVLHGIAPINTAANPVSPKVLGTEDEFKEGAACGNSVLKVAHQMISSTRAPRGFTVAAPEDEEEAMAPDARYNLAARRGSKSLPVTPAHSPPGSPNSRRRRNHNRFFTSPFEPAEDAAQRSWLSLALLGFKKDLAASTFTLAEEDGLEARLHGLSLAQSVESLGPAPRARAPAPAPAPPAPAPPAPAFRAKPSELREMNFWSPTSM